MVAIPSRKETHAGAFIRSMKRAAYRDSSTSEAAPRSERMPARS
jgi:hypothetical protein